MLFDFQAKFITRQRHFPVWRKATAPTQPNEWPREETSLFSHLIGIEGEGGVMLVKNWKEVLWKAEKLVLNKQDQKEWAPTQSVPHLRGLKGGQLNHNLAAKMFFD